MKTITFWRVGLLATVFSVCIPAFGQDKQRFTVTPSADLVSSYIWRGAYNGGISFQPSLTLSYGGFSLEAWGSTDFSTSNDQSIAKEIDFTLGYEWNGFSLAVTDYWWEGEGSRYGRYSSDHYFEGTVGYSFGESFPLSLSWSTMFAGGDKDIEGDRLYSSYFEVLYEFDVWGVTVIPSVGISPWKSMYSEEFNVASIGLKAAKDIRVTDSFSIPLFTEVIVSPSNDNVYMVFGLSF